MEHNCGMARELQILLLYPPLNFILNEFLFLKSIIIFNIK